MELSVTVNRNSFNWGTEATQAIQKFFEVERQAKELFAEDKLNEIIKFYTTDKVKKVGSLYNEIAHLKNWIKIVHCDTFVLRLSFYTKTN